MLAKARNRVGLSQKEVSDLLGLTSPQYISNVERGICLPSPRILRKMSAIYGVEYQDIAKSLINKSMYQRLLKLKKRYACL